MGCVRALPRDVSNLEVGDVIELNPDLPAQTNLRIAGNTCFIGEIGLEGEQVAFPSKSKHCRWEKTNWKKTWITKN